MANACIIQCNVCLSWSIAPLGASLVVVLFNDGMLVEGVSLIENERSKIALYGREECGTIAIGQILSCGGGLSCMSCHQTRRACPFLIFSCTLLSN
jgi:hypothetical protein